MAALSTALDDMNNLKLGENYNQEYRWSLFSKEELICQFYFQLTRTESLDNLIKIYKIILCKVFTKNPNIEDIKLVYKLMANTRDIIAGKGEYNLTYMQISEMYKFTQSSNCEEKDKIKIVAMVTSFIELLVRLNINEHPYGSWKDMKYLCNYHVRQEDRSEYRMNEKNDAIINKVIELIVGQLSCDVNSPVKSLLAKWIPREKSERFGWLTQILAVKYYNKWYNSDLNKDLNKEQISGARRKCLTHFRQLVSKINKELDTTQIKQCQQKWSDINFEKGVTSITMRKQSKAFQNVTKNNKERKGTVGSEDRKKCAENYSKYIENCKSGKVEAKGKRVSIVDFVKDAIKLTYNETMNETEKDAINNQWNSNSLDNGKLKNMIAMVDTSRSMETENGDPLYSAIGLGIRIAEKSNFGKRVLTFSGTPSWVNLDDCDNFVDMVIKVRSMPWGVNTNFRSALDLILNAAIENKVSKEDMEEMVLVILSDMQIDMADSPDFPYSPYMNDYPEFYKPDNSQMFEMMREKYKRVGYKMPHIVFWNLRSTNGFPNLSSENNTSMMSGFSTSLLNSFCDKGYDSLKELTPYKNLKEQLSYSRYNYLDTIVDNLWSTP